MFAPRGETPPPDPAPPLARHPDPETVPDHRPWDGAARAQDRSRTEDARGLILWTVGVVLASALVVWAVIAARQVLLLIYVSGLLAVGLAPFMRWLERQTWLPIGPHGLPRWAAILLLYVSLLGALAGVGVLVLPTLFGQAQDFAQHVPAMIERLQRWLVARGVLAERLTVREMVQQAPVGSDTVGTLLVTIWGLLGGVFGLLTILILTFYFLVDAEALFESFVRMVPRGRRRQVRAMSREITLKVSAWLGGQLMLAGVIGVTAAVGLGLLGVPYFYVLALIAAVGELIPYLGPLIAAVPGIAIATSSSWELAVAVTVFYVVQQQFENYVLVPRIMEAQVGLGPATVLIALLIGGALLGVVGAILAVPTAAILLVILQAVMPADDA